MLYLIIVGLCVALAWLARRHRFLSRNLAQLAAALKQRTPFLTENQVLQNSHASWSDLVTEANRLVSEANRLNQQQAGQLKQLDIALGNLQEAVLIVDRDNYVLLANRALQTIFPGSRSILGERLELVLRNAGLLDYLGEVRSGAAPARREIEFTGPGGSTWVEATGVQIPDTAGPGGPWTLFVLHDITRQRRLEVVRREFVASVSHELKTPLSVIHGYIETLVDDHRTMSAEDRDQFVRTIHRHSQRLAAIVQDLLALSQLESNTPGLNPTRHDLKRLLEAIVGDYVDSITTTDHEFALALAGMDDVGVVVDGLRITQVISNLLDNARKYTPSGSRVEIGARRAGPSEVEVWVSDDGPGIPAGDLPRIFERFYRVEKGRSRETGGTGLGLSIVKHIVQLHGGRVWAESGAGEGTRISFTIPRQASTPAGAMEPDAKARASQEAVGERRS